MNIVLYGFPEATTHRLARHYALRIIEHPDQFAEYKRIGLAKGFRVVESAPLVRSSYCAERHVAPPVS